MRCFVFGKKEPKVKTKIIALPMIVRLKRQGLSAAEILSLNGWVRCSFTPSWGAAAATSCCGSRNYMIALGAASLKI